MKDVEKYLNQLLGLNDCIVISLSGGPDSMCLLSFLIPFIKTKNIKIIAAHVNHRVREESKEEEEFVRDYCRVNNVVFELLTINRYNKKNFHDDARIQRYIFLDELMKKYKAKDLFTAHHGDDLIETSLMRIERGSNLTGYAGFKKEMIHHGYSVIRPFINVSKSDIQNYNNENNIPYRVDKTNLSDDYKRNRYRHHILPLLKKEMPSIQKKYYKFSQELYQYDDFITSFIDNRQIIIDKTIDLIKLKAETDFIQKKAVELYIRHFQQDYEFYMTDSLVNEIIKCINSNKPNILINLSNNFMGIKEYNKFYINQHNLSKAYDIVLEDKIEINNWVIEKTNMVNDTSNFVFCFLSNEISLPIHIRPKKNGDIIKVKNLGTKKVKDIMIDSKIPKQKRDVYPLIVDDKNVILGIPGIKKSQFVKDKSEKYDIIIKCKEI